MAKVVLVWNEHPTEVVAGFHARKVANILREKYGHEVVVEKTPVGKTIYGMARAGTPKEAFETLLKDFKIKDRISDEAATKHLAPVFNFHSSSPSVMGQAQERNPDEFNVMEVKQGDHSPFNGFKGEIQFIESGQHHYVEVPGILEDLPKKSKAKQEKRIKAVRDARPLDWDAIAGTDPSLADHYQLKRTPLGKSEQQKYLHPAISEKIAAAIHERITEKRK